jgi:hypothetical protein
MAVPFGSIIGMVLTGCLFDDKTDVKIQMFSLLLKANIVLFIVYVMFLTTFREKPQNPPSAIAL